LPVEYKELLLFSVYCISFQPLTFLLPLNQVIYYQSFLAMPHYLAAAIHCCGIVLETDRLLFEPANCAIDFGSSHFLSFDYDPICCLMVESSVLFGPSSCAGFHRLPAVSFQF
jgi:hypothetical protein